MILVPAIIQLSTSQQNYSKKFNGLICISLTQKLAASTGEHVDLILTRWNDEVS